MKRSLDRLHVHTILLQSKQIFEAFASRRPFSAPRRGGGAPDAPPPKRCRRLARDDDARHTARQKPPKRPGEARERGDDNRLSRRPIEERHGTKCDFYPAGCCRDKKYCLLSHCNIVHTLERQSNIYFQPYLSHAIMTRPDNTRFAAGVDIGGSHVSSTVVDLLTGELDRKSVV